MNERDTASLLQEPTIWHDSVFRKPSTRIPGYEFSMIAVTRIQLFKGRVSRESKLKLTRTLQRLSNGLLAGLLLDLFFGGGQFESTAVVPGADPTPGNSGSQLDSLLGSQAQLHDAGSLEAGKGAPGVWTGC